MEKEPKTKEEFIEDIHKEFPTLEFIRERELNKTKHKLLDQSSIGKTSSIIYFFIAISSIFVYWKFYRLGIIFSLFLALITWFVITYIFDKLLIKILGIDRAVNEASKKDIDESLEKLKGHGMIK